MNKPIKIEIKLLYSTVSPPDQAYHGDAGVDLKSRIDVDLAPGARALIPTGIAISIPDGYAGFVQPRSGLAIHHGVSLVNAPGLIDSKYRGEISVIMINHDLNETFSVKTGEKIAQLVIQEVVTPEFQVVDELDQTDRGVGGFGSSGG